MQQFKGTPGGWTAENEPAQTFGDGEYDAGGYRIDAPGIEQLAFVWRASRRFGSGEAFGAHEAEANARLIAAAPDLLAALQSLLSGADHQNIATARAAIARALGGE